MPASIEPILESESGIEVVIRTDQNQGVEVQHLRSYGVGIDCHSKFISICVHVRNNHKILRYSCEADTDWNSLVLAKQWVLDTIQKHSDPVPDLSQPLHYVIEATSTYHMPVVRAWQGLPSVINPMIAGAAKKKTDKLDAERLSFHDLTEVWESSYVPSDDIQELRVLIAERDHFLKLATQCSNRINNIIVRFGLTIGRGSSVTKNPDIRALLEDLISDSPSAHDNICPLSLPPDIKHLIRLEYRYYDEFTSQADYFLQLIRQKVLSMEWETKDGSLSGDEMVRLLCTTPGVGEITCFTWLAYIGTPNRFRNAKALAAYAGLDPSLKVSAGKVTSTKKRGGCQILHKILVAGADRIMRNHSEAFGRWGYQMAISSGKWKKGSNAVGRKMCTAMYYMMLTAQEFSYKNYNIMKDAVIFDISVNDLPLLNSDFKRYIRILHDHKIHTTADLITAYLSCSLGSIKGLGRKFFVTLQDFVSNQNKYKSLYQKLSPSAVPADMTILNS